MTEKAKIYEIVVEATMHEWTKATISFDEVVALEFPNYLQNPNITFSVTYERGQGNKPEGVLVKSASVKVKKGMVFHVSETGQS